MPGTAELTTLLAPFERLILYQPLRTEVPIREYLSISDTLATYTLPARAAVDPFAEAIKAAEFVGNGEAALLIPGRRFDAAGTRQGQGGGWYDRFLSRVPRAWLRIGVCYPDQFSAEPLVRRPWDEPMDYVAVVDRSTGTISLYSSEGHGDTHRSDSQRDPSDRQG